MKWCPRERTDAEIVAALAARSPVPVRMVPASPVVIRETDLDLYRHELADPFRSVFTRHLSALCGLDEHRATSWRLEHKLIQAHLLDHYVRGVIPVTAGASHFKSVPPGAVVKNALGDSSGDRGSWHTELPRVSRPVVFVTDEECIVQEIVHVADEYRVHSVDGVVVEDLTFLRYRAGDLTAGDRAAPNAFVQALLDVLPAAISAGSLWGWDVARAKDGRFFVIELNVSGFHPVFRRGYQCSGYLHDATWGAKSVARLLRHLRDRHTVAVEIACDAPELSPEASFYREVRDWMQVIDDEDLAEARSREIGRRLRLASSRDRSSLRR